MIYVNLICIALFVSLYMITRNYKKEEIEGVNKKEHSFYALYPMGLFLMDKFIQKIPIKITSAYSNRVKESLESLYIGEKTDVKRLYQCKKLVFVLVIIFISNVFSAATYISNRDDTVINGMYLSRGKYGEGESLVNLHVKVRDEDVLILEEDMEVKVDERKVTEEEANQLLEEGISYIDKVILGENQDRNAIRDDLVFPTSIRSSGIKITWTTEDNSIIDNNGCVKNDELRENKLVWVRASLELNGSKAEYISYFNICPKNYTKEELLKKQLLEEINDINKDTTTKEQMILPTKIEDKDITWSEIKENQGTTLFFLGIIVAFLIYFFMDKDLVDKVEKRNQEMLLDYPDIINKFTLLVSAGMSVSNAWCKVADDYKKEEGDMKYAYEEMKITARELSVGISEITAYERFGRRVKILPYLRFSSLLAQNVKKGSKDLLEQLELESLEAFEERKELAKRLGEEAGTKLLVPMILMLIIVLCIILIPAFLSFQF